MIMNGNAAHTNTNTKKIAITTKRAGAGLELKEKRLMFFALLTSSKSGHINKVL